MQLLFKVDILWATKHFTRISQDIKEVKNRFFAGKRLCMYRELGSLNLMRPDIFFML